MATNADVGGVVREVLVEDTTDKVIVGGVVREVLVEDVPQARVSGVRREVLVEDQPDKWVLGPRWPRRMAVIEEPENDPDFEALALMRHRRSVAIGPAQKHLRPYLQINS